MGKNDPNSGNSIATNDKKLFSSCGRNKNDGTIKVSLDSKTAYSYLHS